MFAFFSMRFAEIKDCFSLVSTTIGTFGFGHLISFGDVFFFEKIFSICFFIIMFVVCPRLRSLFLLRRLLGAFSFLCGGRRSGRLHLVFF